jgi:hypothetical protein
MPARVGRKHVHACRKAEPDSANERVREMQSGKIDVRVCLQEGADFLLRCPGWTGSIARR